MRGLVSSSTGLSHDHINGSKASAICKTSFLAFLAPSSLGGKGRRTLAGGITRDRAAGGQCASASSAGILNDPAPRAASEQKLLVRRAPRAAPAMSWNGPAADGRGRAALH